MIISPPKENGDLYECEIPGTDDIIIVGHFIKEINSTLPNQDTIWIISKNAGLLICIIMETFITLLIIILKVNLFLLFYW